jgi:hypothetical protein
MLKEFRSLIKIDAFKDGFYKGGVMVQGRTLTEHEARGLRGIQMRTLRIYS